jgi:hypothetical protein
VLKKAKFKNNKDVREIDRLLAELEALEWLQGQIAMFSHGDNNEAVLGYWVLLLLQLMWQGTREEL